MPAETWLVLMPEIRTHRQNCDDAVTQLTASVTSFLEHSESPPDIVVAEYNKMLEAWGLLLNEADRFAALGLTMWPNYPDPATYLVAGTIIELIDNLLEAAGILSDQATAVGGLDPIEQAAKQPRAFECAQRLLSKSFPDEIATLRHSFRQRGLPTKGFDELEQGPASQPSLGLHCNVGGPQAAEGARLRILHISDIHRTPDQSANNHEVLDSLLLGLARIDPGKLDLIVVSGDITQSASMQEYNEAQEFLTGIVDKLLDGNRNHCIVVPGNHDVDWNATLEGSFQTHRGEIHRDGRQHFGAVEIEGGFMVPTPETAYAAKKNFNEFYKEFFGREYGLKAEERWDYIEPDALPVGIIALDTSVGMHHLSDQAEVPREALTSALKKARESDRKLLLAVGHHGPITRRAQTDGLDTWVLTRLRDNRVALYLHGHTHETQMHTFTQDGNIHLPCIGVGSLVAGPKQRPESTPRQYHIVEIPLLGGQGLVKVRRKETQDSPWSIDQRWGPPTTPSDKLHFRR